MEAFAAAPYSLQTPEWLVFLCTVCAVAEGAGELAGIAGVSAAAACVLAVLGDLRRRIAVLGGREGMPRSLGSVLGGSVTRFLGGFRGGNSRTIEFSWGPYFSSVAVCHDGFSMLASHVGFASDAIHMVSVQTGVLLRTIGGYGVGPLQFRNPCQVCVASDGYVFVAERCNNRIQILTPRYDFHGFVGVGQLTAPSGVCANNDVIVVSDESVERLGVFDRRTGALIRRFGRVGTGDGRLFCARGLCFMSGHRNVAVADSGNNCINVYTLEGKFVRSVGIGALVRPLSVVCSDADELVVADYRVNRILMFSASGDIVWASAPSATFAAAGFCAVAMRGSTIFGQTVLARQKTCVVFTFT